MISEFHFRQALLSEPIHSPDTKFDMLAKGSEGDASGKYFQAISLLSGLFDKMIDAAGNLEVPVISQFFKVILGFPKTGFKLAEVSVATALQSALHGANIGAHALAETFKILFAYTDILPTEVVGGPFYAIEQALDAAVTCFATASKIENQFNVATCSVYADIYRGVVDEVASKPIEVPSDASEELKRAISGAQSVVDLSKSSVATTNEDLLTTRPIFMADVLDQFREEVNCLATSDDIKNYAQLRRPLLSHPVMPLRLDSASLLILKPRPRSWMRSSTLWRTRITSRSPMKTRTRTTKLSHIPPILSLTLHLSTSSLQ